MIADQVCDRLKQIRKALHMTQDEFSLALQVSKPTISRYETGDRCPDTEFLQILLLQYHVNANWLLGGTGQMFLDEKSTSDEEIKELLALLDIPQFRRGILAEADKLKQLYVLLIKQHFTDKEMNRGKKKKIVG